MRQKMWKPTLILALLVLVLDCGKAHAQALPSGWSHGDVGTVGLTGSATFANGVFTVSGAGSQIYGTADSFHFAYEQVSGDATILARVVSVQGGSGYVAAGVMVRETLNTGSTNAKTAFWPTYSTIYFDARTSTGSFTSEPGSASASLPYWVKVVRSGSTFSSYVSPDSVTWTQLGTGQTISMAQSVYVGLAVTSGTTSALATATLDYVSISTPSAPAPAITGLSATSGSIGSQVVVSGSGFGASQGSSAVFLNDAAVTINTWSATSITITIPAGASSGPLAVLVAPGMNASNAVAFKVLLPGPWSDQDIGAVSFSGNAKYVNDVFTVVGSSNGTGIGGTADAFHFVYQSMSGDGTIVARVASTNSSYAQAGVMIRATLDPGSANIFMADSSGTRYLYERTSAGANTSHYTDVSSATPPIWVKLVRSGNVFSAYVSPDAEAWVQFGTSQTISMAQNVYVGLAVDSGGLTTTATATFDNVSVSTPSAPAPAITGLSATTGTVGSQVTISGSGFGASQGNSAVFLNEVPVTISTWSASSIHIVIPAGASSGYLTVSVAPGMNDSNPETFTMTGQALPTGWLDEDIGPVGLTGSATYASGVFTVKGAGNQIGGTADAFHFVYQPLSGDGTMVARVVSTDSGYVQAGTMVRETLDTSPASAYMDIGSCILLERPSLGANTSTDERCSVSITLPYWVKLVRSGNGFSGYISADGVNWVQIGISRTINMGQSVYIGLGVSRQSTNVLGTATFDSVSVSSTIAPAPIITSVSATTGSVGSQVVISGSGFGTSQGSSVVYLNGAPVTINTWSATSIQITIPAGATSGPLVVSVGPSMIDSNSVTFTVTSSPLPGGWLDQDIGVFGPPAGSATYASGVFTLKGSGTGLGGTSDGFHFVYQPLTTNGTLVARIASLQGSAGALAGITIRETLDGFASDVFPYYFGQTANMSYRTVPGGPARQVYAASVTLPTWVKVVRSANSFSGYSSTDGAHWVLIGTTQTFVTAQKVYVGLAASDGSNSTLCTATFDNVSLTLGTSLANPVITSLSTTAGAPGASVTINGSGFGATQGTGGGASTVSFNGATAAVTSWSDAQIGAVVPAGGSTGPVSVTVGNITAQGPTFTVSLTVQLTDSLSNNSSYTSQLFGGQWGATDSQGSGCSSCSSRGTLHNQYDGSGNIVWTTDALGHTTLFRYDSSNNLISKTVQVDANTTAVTAYTYNSFGEVLTMTDALGNVTTNTYDATGNLLSVTTPPPGGGPSGSVTTFTYYTNGLLKTITDPLNNVTTIVYFPTGLIQTIKDAQNNVTTYAYDTHGNRTSVTDALNKQTTFTYDTGDRLKKITYPDTTTTQFGYDYRGRRTTVTDQNGKITTYGYDDEDRLTTVTDASTPGNVTTYGYDTENNLTSIKDANNHTTTFTPDAFGRVTKTTFPSTQIETYAYDTLNNLTSKTDRNGHTITYVYDALNRLSKKQYPDSTEVDYVYDLVNRIQSVNDPTGTYGFTYDNMNRLTGTTTNYSFLARQITTSISYDKASNRTGFIDPESGSTAYVYDTLNRLQTLTPPAAFGSGSFGFGYDVLSRRTSLTRPNNVTTNYGYDNLSRLTSALHQLSGSTIDGAAYTPDNAGNRTSKTDKRTNVTSNYGYDAIYELTGVTQGTTTTESYTYDPVGNRLSSLGVSPYAYNSSNELTSKPSFTYTYDLNGNTLTSVTGSNTTTYTWDFENRMTSATLPGTGGSVTFKYDPFGRRIQKSFTQNSTTTLTNYLYDGDNSIEEVDQNGSVLARYTQTQNIDEPLAELRSGTTSFYQADGLGSVTSLSNSAGAIANTYTYDSYGKLTASTGSLVNPFRYTARESDTETGLYYYRARYYDPQAGRFLGEDPIGFDGGGNFYRYVYNSPVGLSDPMGLSAADVQQILKACHKCTDRLTAKGERLAGSGLLNGLLNNLISGLTLGLKYSGCDRQANLTSGCLDSPSSPYNDHWDFSPMSVHWGLHRVTRGHSSNPSDPDVICDSWKDAGYTVPRSPDKSN
jgi:RHS repeat-associated protein